jgi:hypothetical protein
VVSHSPFLLSSSPACSLPQRSPVGPCLTRSPPLSRRHPKLCYTRPPVPASAQWRACIRPCLGGRPTSCLPPRCRLRACANPAPATGYTSRHRPPPRCTPLPADRHLPRCSPLPVVSGRAARPSLPPQAASSCLPAADRELGPLHPCSALHGPPPQWSERGNKERRGMDNGW